MSDYRFCACGMAMYAIEGDDGEWIYVCEGCDPSLMQQVEVGES